MHTPCVTSSLLALTAVTNAHFSAFWTSSPNQHSRLSQLLIADNTSPVSMHFTPSDGSEAPPPPKGDVILSDVIGSSRPINIFAGFTRDIESVSSRLDTLAENSTILAPSNSAISALLLKPWEDAREYTTLGVGAYEGKDGKDRANCNLKRFTEAHIVPKSPWTEAERVQSLGGSTLWWELKDGTAYVQPGNVEVERVASRAKNGEVWVLKGVLNDASQRTE